MESPRIQLGRYVLHAQLASGGMASVYLARMRADAGFSRTVAVKRMHPQFAREPEFVNMFVDEARLAARIHHPNVVQTLDVVVSEGEMFLVMEYVRGEPLSALIRSASAVGQRLPVSTTASIMVGMLSGLHAAHESVDERGAPLAIVHRDVSPQNVLVGSDGIARVLDFGVAKASTRLQSTREGELKGKLAYMPPEQFDGVVTSATDIYAASVVLWESLVGRRLFRADTEAQLIRMIHTMPVPPPSSVHPGVSPALDAVVARGLSRDPAGRFASAQEMADAIASAASLGTPREVGRVLEQYLGPVLEQRRSLVSSIETAADDVVPAQIVDAVSSHPSLRDVPSGSVRHPPVSADVPAPGEIASQSPRARRLPVALAIGGAAALAVAVTLVVVSSKAPAPAPPSAASAVHDLPSIVVSPAPAAASASVAATPLNTTSASARVPSQQRTPRGPVAVPPKGSASASPVHSAPTAANPVPNLNEIPDDRSN